MPNRRTTLNDSERSVLGLLSYGLTQEAVALELFLPASTVEIRVRRSKEILGANNTVNLIAIAVGHRLIPVPRSLIDDSSQE